MKTILALSLLLFAITSCSEPSSKKQLTTSVLPTEKSDTTSTTKKSAKQNEVSSRTVDKLLIGKWQHTEDKENILEFTNNMRIEIGEGMTEADEEPYELALSCMSDPQTEENEDPNRVYIWCPASFMCWEIMSVNEKNLTLIYTARGNLLTYKRIK